MSSGSGGGATRMLRKSMAALTPGNSQGHQRVRKRSPSPIDEHKPPKPSTPAPRPASVSISGGEADIAPRPPIITPMSAADALEAGGHGGGGTEAPAFRGFMSKKGEISLFKSPWKRRFFVLEKGELTYFPDEASWQRGEKPIKGHRISVSEFHVSLPSTTAAALGPGASIPQDSNADIVLTPSSSSSEHRTWQFICEAKAEVQGWFRALISHGARPPAMSPSASFLTTTPSSGGGGGGSGSRLSLRAAALAVSATMAASPASPS